jgi:hypothetical protein
MIIFLIKKVTRYFPKEIDAKPIQPNRNDGSFLILWYLEWLRGGTIPVQNKEGPIQFQTKSEELLYFIRFQSSFHPVTLLGLTLQCSLQNTWS